MTFEFSVKIIVVIGTVMYLFGCAAVNVESGPVVDRTPVEVAAPPPPPPTLSLGVPLEPDPAVNSNQVTYDNAQRIKHRPAADQGDAVAQFQLGEAYCCGKGFYDTDEAIRWWCKAAVQSHFKAQQRLRVKLGGYSPETCPQL